MLDSPKMLSIGISISKKLDGSKLKEASFTQLPQLSSGCMFDIDSKLF